MDGTNLDVLKMKLEKLSGLMVEANKNRSDLTSQYNTTRRAIKSYEKKQLEKTTGVDVYGSDDYWGLSVGKYKFYFGYEYLMCLKHSDCSCDDKEWCFVASVDDKEVMRIPESRLGGDTGERQLLHGVGQFLSKCVDLRWAE